MIRFPCVDLFHVVAPRRVPQAAKRLAEGMPIADAASKRQTATLALGFARRSLLVPSGVTTRIGPGRLPGDD